MFGWLKKKPAPSAFPLAELRETLFGDLPLERWTGGGSDAEPWTQPLAALPFFARNHNRRLSPEEHVDSGTGTIAHSASECGGAVGPVFRPWAASAGPRRISSTPLRESP